MLPRGQLTLRWRTPPPEAAMDGHSLPQGATRGPRAGAGALGTLLDLGRLLGPTAGYGG